MLHGRLDEGLPVPRFFFAGFFFAGFFVLYRFLPMSVDAGGLDEGAVYPPVGETLRGGGDR